MAKMAGSKSNWDPGEGKGRNDSKLNKLFSTDAQERPDAVNGTNERKEFVGGKGVPKGPFGKKGHEF